MEKYLSLCLLVSNKGKWSSGKTLPLQGKDDGSIPSWPKKVLQNLIKNY